MKTKETYLKDYIPSINEQYMNAKQVAYFKENLEVWRLQTHHNLSEMERRLAELNASDEHDEMDRALIETEVAITINKISTLQTLLHDIDLSLADIEMETYGYCKKTGKEIGVKRLMAKPTSRFAIKAQEENEREVQIKQKIEDDIRVQDSTDEMEA